MSRNLRRASTEGEGGEHPEERERVVTNERIREMPFLEEKRWDGREWRFWWVHEGKKGLWCIKVEERDIVYWMNNIWLIACNPFDIWFIGWITIELLHAFHVTLGLLYG